MSERFFHIYSQSSKVVFRSEDDYLMAINRLFTCAGFTGVIVLAYAIMSTHFHLMVRTKDPDSFIKRYKRTLALWHRYRYKTSLHIKVGMRVLDNHHKVMTALDYVLKNPMHHEVAEVATHYPYSSAHCYYANKIGRQAYYRDEARGNIRHTYCTPQEVPLRARRVLFGRYVPPGRILVMDNRLVVPATFVDVATVCGLYGNVHHFMQHMSKPLAEDLKSTGNDQEDLGSRRAALSLSGKLSDIELCQYIDSAIHPATYAQLSNTQIEALWLEVCKLGVSRVQFNRAI